MRYVKIIAAALAALMLFGCGANEEPATGRRPKPTPTVGQTVESSLFGKSVSYDAFSPAEVISLPQEANEAAEVVQIEKSLYFLYGGSVHRLDLETGGFEKLFDTDAGFLADDGENLYTYSAGGESICEYSPAGEMLSQRTLRVEDENTEVRKLIVTDSFFSFVCLDKSGEISVAEHLIYDRETLESAGKISEGESYFDASGYKVFGRYKGDSILKIEESLMDSRFMNICEIDLAGQKTEQLGSIEAGGRGGIGSEVAFSYREKTDTLLVFSAPSTRTTPFEDYTPFLCECSLSDPDNVVLKRYYLDAQAIDHAFVSEYENIVSIITLPGPVLNFYDYLNPPESVTLACSTAGSYADIIKNFEKDTGVTVKTVSYGTDWQRLDVKLMAGDRDFDLFEPVYMHQHKYFFSGMFEDLSQYEGLKKRLDGNLAASFVSSLDGKYIGIPTGMQNIGTKEVYPEDGSQWTYSIAISKQLYLARNLDIAEGIYKDPDGSELYKLLRFIYDNPEGNESKMPFGDKINVLSNGFILMNPSGTNKENAVRFLEYMFDALSGGIESVVPKDRQYMNLESTDGWYVYWRYFAADYTEPITGAYAAALRSDGKSGTLKQIAREAAAEVKMRLEE